MTKQEFEELFRNQLELAARNAEDRFKMDIPRKFKIRLFPKGTARGNKVVDFDSAAEALYLDGQLLPLYIDIAVEAVTISRQFTVACVVAGGTERVQPNLTWNFVEGSGPFKQQINEELTIIPDP